MPTNSLGPLARMIEWGLPTHGAISGEAVPNTCYVALAGLPAVLSAAEGLKADAVLFGTARSWHPAERSKTIGADSHVYRGPDGGTWTIRVVVGAWSSATILAAGSVTAPLTVYAKDRFDPEASEFVLLSTTITIGNPFAVPYYRWPGMSYPKPDGSAVMVSSFGSAIDYATYTPPAGATNIAVDPRYWKDFLAAHEVTISGDGGSLSASVALHTAQSVASDVAPTYQSIAFGSRIASQTHGEVNLPGDPYWTFYGTTFTNFPYQNPPPNGQYSTFEAAAAAVEAWLQAEWYFTAWTTAWTTAGDISQRGWRQGGTGYVVFIRKTTPGIVYATIEGTVENHPGASVLQSSFVSRVLSVVYDKAGAAVVWKAEQQQTGSSSPSVLPSTFDASTKIGGSSRQRHFAEKKSTGIQAKTSLFDVTGEYSVTTTTRIKKNGTTVCEKTIESRTRQEDYYYWHKPEAGYLSWLFALEAHVLIESRYIDGVLAWRQATSSGSTTAPSVPAGVDLTVLGKVRSFSAARTANNTAGIIGTSIPDDPRLFAAASPEAAATIGDDGVTYANAPWVCWNPRTGEISLTEGASWC